MALRLRERRQVQRLRRPEPHDMFGMVLDGLARLRVGEYRQPVSIHDQPRDDLRKQLGPERELAASARMRADGFVVHAPDGEAEGPASLGAKLLRSLAARGVEIDV